MMKNDEKKIHLKNEKVEHVLVYHFLNDENHAQIVSPVHCTLWKVSKYRPKNTLFLDTLHAVVLSPTVRWIFTPHWETWSLLEGHAFLKGKENSTSKWCWIWLLWGPANYRRLLKCNINSGNLAWKLMWDALCDFFTKSNTPTWFFFTFFKLYKCYKIAQSIAYNSSSLSLWVWQHRYVMD